MLLEDAWDVVGVTLQLQNASTEGADQAAAVSRQLGIQHLVLNRAGDFEKMVRRPSWEEYASGRTPCPCMRCNDHMKFSFLLDWALENGFDAMATGHYAILNFEGGQVRLLRGKDRNKDQSYFLAGLTQERMSRLTFPLGGFDKPWVRKKAAELGLVVAERSESQDACFIAPGLTFSESLRARFGDTSVRSGGFIIDWDGRRLAQHDGVHNFTIGQRRGVKIGTGARAWVCRVDALTGDVYLTNTEEDLLSRRITLSDITWTTAEPPPLPMDCEVQVRYRAVPVPATLLDVSEGRGSVVLHQPVRAAAPGQAAVFYDGDRVLGRGWMCNDSI
jgi:tRNA-specific 2-thiouridylase